MHETPSSAVLKQAGENKNGAVNGNRPNPVVDPFPERNITFRKRTVPGHASYSEVVQRERFVTVFSDSIAKGIRRHEFNKYLHRHSAKFYAFPGIAASRLGYHMKPYLEEEPPDVALIHVGANNITSSNQEQTTYEIAHEIMQLGDLCKRNGVNKVLISGITTRRSISLRRRAVEVNSILKESCEERGFTFIDNGNISSSDLWDDGLHLAESGKAILANNFIFHVNGLYSDDTVGRL